MRYVIVRASDRLFVAKPGRKSSYTNALQNAKIYKSQEEAEADRCPGNEYVLSVDSLLEE